VCRFIVGVLHLLPFLVSAQTECVHTLAGRVVDTEAAVLPGAAVLLSPGSGVVADASGSFAFTGRCRGKYLLIVRHVGYEEWRDSVPVPQSGLIVTLRPEIRQLNNVIVEDKRSHGSISQTESLLTGKRLERVAGRPLGEALKSLPGVTALQTGPTVFKPAIHGLHSNRVLILNNEIRLEGQQWGADHAPEIDPFTASSVSVIKDAAAIKYGSDALAGVVMVSPPELPSQPGLGGEVSLIGSGNGRMGVFSGQLEGSPKNNPALGWRVQGTLRKTGDFRAAGYSLTNTGMEEANVSAAFGYHAERKGLEAFVSHFSGGLGILRGSVTGSLEDLATAMETEPPAYTSDFSYAITSPRQRAQHDLIKLKGHHHFLNDQVLTFQYGFQHNHRQEYDVRRGTLNEIPSIDLKLSTHTLDGEWEHVHKDRRLGSTGLNLLFQNNENVPGTQRIPFVPNFQNLTAGLYLIEQWPRDRWTLESGVRYDFRSYDVRGRDYRNELYTSSFMFSNLSGTAGAQYALSVRSNVKTNLGVAWRPPNVAELYSFGLHQSAGAIEYGLLLDQGDNHILDPDSAGIHSEVAFKWVNTYSLSAQRVKLEATAHVAFIDNFIYLRPGGVTTTVRGAFPFFRYDQAAALFTGLDGFVSWAMSGRISLEGKVSLLYASDVENKDVFLYIPSNQGQITLQYQFPGKGSWLDGYFSAGAHLVARQGNAPRTITVSEFIAAIENGQDPLGGDGSNFDFADAPSGYALATVQAGITRVLRKGRIVARAEINNLMNQAYREYTNRMRYYADDIGRNFTLAFKYVF
jgi:iron complex outermembrane receptor protein